MKNKLKNYPYHPPSLSQTVRVLFITTGSVEWRGRVLLRDERQHGRYGRHRRRRGLPEAEPPHCEDELLHLGIHRVKVLNGVNPPSSLHRRHVRRLPERGQQGGHGRERRVVLGRSAELDGCVEADAGSGRQPSGWSHGCLGVSHGTQINSRAVQKEEILG
jgi:hypothetical protein